MTKTKSHLVLLGDSIFDNAIYVPGELAVIDHMRHTLPASWKATLIAHDGDVVANVENQIAKIPLDATHLVVSIGGNDALNALGIFSDRVDTVGEGLLQLSQIRRDFQRRYRTMLWQVLSAELPLAICTIYDAIPDLSVESQTALAIFNDTIVREAFAAKVPVIDLRLVCTERNDYSALSPIEPSEVGGRKIALAIAEWLNSMGMEF
ncbi:MAG: SGNH/GDSL hydrolase family protein [Alphaproteobacteria bacterium]|nr:hypothetical protein [Burkholderiaceae bacterium]MBY0292128.1 SGNH/GDSL hydrolase family protein [Alphaproteobacteria bacterium]